MSKKHQSCMTVIALCLSVASAIGQDGAPQREPAAALAHAIRLLTVEAQEALQERRLPRASADFASSYPDPVHPEMLARRLMRPIERDPFIDAYVRWQLTGFDAALPEMSDREFERFVEDLPAMVNNPRADDRLINDLQRIVQRGELTESQQEQVNERLNRMAADTGTASEMNLPATRFREWARRQVESDGRQAITLALEHVASMVRTGWRVEDLKQQVFELCESHKTDLQMTDEDRLALERIANRLAGTSRLYVTSAGVRTNALAANFEETGIYDFDANRWMRALRRD